MSQARLRLNCMLNELKAIRNQHTIADAVEVSGFGYWSGRDVTIQFQPSGPNTGISFHVGSGSTKVVIPAAVSNRVEVPRRTNLRVGHFGVDMVEHVMAALAGLQIDNCNILCSSQEMPGCDGSSFTFVEALRNSGKVEQDAVRKGLVVSRSVRVGTDESWILAQPVSDAVEHPATVLQYNLDYGSDCVIRPQSYRLAVTPQCFEAELAPARTFVLEHEADEMRSQGLGLRVTTDDLIVFNSDGPVGTELRFSNECARHKVLDMVGDFALSGIELIGEFEAFRAGHHLNAALIRELFTAHNLSQSMMCCA